MEVNRTCVGFTNFGINWSKKYATFFDCARAEKKYFNIPLFSDVYIGDFTASGKFSLQDIPGTPSVHSIYKKLCHFVCFFRENTDFTNLLQEKTTRLLTPVFHKRVSFWSKSEQQQQSSARGDILAMLAGKTAKIWTKKPQLLAFVASLNGNAGSPMGNEGDELG